MGTSLNGLTPAATYQGLIKFGDNSIIGATQRYLSDGAGNDLPIAVSTTKVGIGSTTGLGVLNVRGTDGSSSNYTFMASSTTASFYIRNDGLLYNAEQGRISNVYIANLASNSIHSTQSGSGGGALYLSALGTGIGNTTPFTPAAMAHIKGSGSTGSTKTLTVQNSSNLESLYVKDDGVVGITANSPYLITGCYAQYHDGSGDVLYRGGQRIAVNASGAYTCAQLSVDSTNRGVLMPRMTTAQKNAISTPLAGLMVFDTSLAKLCVYSGTAWETITSV